MRAIRFAGDILQTYAVKVDAAGGAWVDVTDDAGRTLYTVRMVVTDHLAAATGE